MLRKNDVMIVGQGRKMNHLFLVVSLTAIVLINRVQSQCNRTDGATGLFRGETYETAPDGTTVATLDFNGPAGTFVLSLTSTSDPSLESVFVIDGNSVKVKDSTQLRRDVLNTGGTPSDDKYTFTGKVLCTDTTTIPYDIAIEMLYINEVEPELSSPATTLSQSEYTAIGTSIFTVQGNDGEYTNYPVEYAIVSQAPTGYFEMSSSSGVVTLKKDLDYSNNQQHTVVVELTDDGVDNKGSKLRRSSTVTFTINIEDYDNLSPEFVYCDSSPCPETFYSASISTKQEYPSPLEILPRSIYAKDPDSADEAIVYEFTGGTDKYDEYFSIDSTSGEVSLLKVVDDPATFAITVKAAQKNRPTDRFSTTYLQITVTANDTFAPTFDQTAYSGSLLDDGSDTIFVKKDGSSELLKVTAEDEDGDALIVYTIQPPDSPFQVSSEGYIFLQRVSGSTRSTTESFSVVAINVNADPASSNRNSGAIPVEVTVTEVTTPEPTTEAPTTEATTIPETTMAPTTIPTTFAETTTYLETTLEPTTEADTTTIPETTMPPTTEPTTFIETTTFAETTAEPTTVPDTTVPETTLAPTTDQTTLPETTTELETTQPETTEFTTIPMTTIFEDTTTVPVTDQTTKLTTIATSSVATTQVNPSSAQSTSESVSSSFSTRSTTISATDLTSRPVTSAVDTSKSTTAPTDSSSTSPASTKTTGTGPTSSEVAMVEASTLYIVASILSVLLFLAILAIVYLVWRLMKMRRTKKDPFDSEEDDAESKVSGSIYQNGAYENELDTKTENDDQVSNVLVGATAAHLVTDLDAESDNFGDNPDASSIHSSLPENHEENLDGEDNNAHSYTAFDDGFDDIDAGPGDDNLPYEPVENDETIETNAFEEELQRRAAEIAAAAAVTAGIAKSVEPEYEHMDDITPKSEIIPLDVIQEEKILTQDAATAVKIVTLKGYGEDGRDVKAIVKSVDTIMSPSSEVDNMKRKIATLEKLRNTDHSNIVKYYGSYEKDGSLHYACQYVENGTLQEKLRNGEIHDPNTMMHIMANVGKGLQYLHANNITHGNLSSKAIVMGPDNNPMLTDIEGDSFVTSDYSEDMRWQALEVNDGDERTLASDVWSYGIVMWEIVSQGAVPYEDVPLFDLAEKMRVKQLPKPNACSEDLYILMTTCWNHDPKRRPDMYVVNSNIAEKLLEDSNEHIRMDVTSSSPSSRLGMHQDDVPPPALGSESDQEMDASDYTAF